MDNNENISSLIISIRNLWILYKNDYGCSNEKQIKLHEFLCKFLYLCTSTKLTNINLIYGDTQEISQSLAWVLLDNLEDIIMYKNPTNSIEERLYSYLSSIENNGGFYLLWLTHLLTLSTNNNQSIAKLSALIVVIIRKLLLSQNISSFINNNYLNLISDIPWIKYFYNTTFIHLRDMLILPNLPESLYFLIEDAEATFDPLFKNNSISSNFIGICYHLLGSLQNISSNSETLDHLVRYNQIQNLLNLLLPRNTSEGKLYIPIYRQIIRTLCKLIESSTTHLKKILQLRQLGIISFLLFILQKKYHTGITCIEICYLIMYTIRRSSQLSLKIFEEFKESNGYKIFSDILKWIGQYGTPNEKYELLGIMSHMMFIRQSEKDAIDDVDEIKNKEAYSIFIHAFEESTSSDFQYDMLRTILPLLKLNESGYKIIRLYIPPFDHLLLQFDGLPLRNKKFILTMIEEVLKDSKLSNQELSTYCLLLQRKKPTTLIMILRQLIKLLNLGIITRTQLEEAGIIHSFLDLANLPTDLQTIHTIGTRKELEQCLGLIDTIEEIQGIEFPIMNTNDFEKYNPPTDIQRIISNVGTKAEVCRVLYSISSLALELMVVFLSTNRNNQQRFCELGVLSKLYPLINDDALRHAVLRIIAVIAIGDKDAIHISIVQNLVSILQHCAGTSSIDPRIIRMRMDILSTFACIFESNKRTKNAFREKFGITWSIAVIDGIGQRIKEEGENIVTKGVLGYLEAFLNIFTILLHNNSRNQLYFRETVQFDAFRDSLSKWKFVEGSEALSLIDNLLDMALAGSFPPSCKNHPLQEENKLHKYSYGLEEEEDDNNNTQNNIKKNTSLNRAKELVYLNACTDCEKCLLVNIPEVITVVLELTGIALSSMNEDTIINIIQKLKFIIKILPENQKRLCSVGFTQVLFDRFYTILQSDSKLHRLILKLLEILAIFHISVAELWKYFKLFSPDGFPTPLLRTFNQICSNQSVSPSNYIQFTSLIGSYIDITLSNRSWPPSNGYSLSMWIKHEGIHNINVLNLASENTSTSLSVCIDNGSYIVNIQTQKDGNISYKFNSDKTNIPLKIWYHVIIVHSPYSISEGKKESQGNAKLYINGIKMSKILVPYPKSSTNGRVSGILGTINDSNIKSKSLPKYSHINPTEWHLGCLYLFEESPSDIEAFLIYQLGPDYIGNIDIDLKNFYNPYSTITPNNIKLLPKQKHGILKGPWSNQLNSLQDKIVFAFSPRNMVFAQSVKVPITTSSPIGNTALVPVFASFDNASIISRSYLRDTISNIGGMSTIIFLIAMLSDSKQRKLSLEILYKLIQYSAPNLQEMNEICGFELIGRIIRKNKWNINEKILSILFRIIGFERDPNLMTFSYGVLSNLSAFEYIILDWRIWKNASLSIQKQVFESLSNIISNDNEFSKFNIIRFRSINVKSKILWLLQNDVQSISTLHAEYIINILRNLMDIAPCVNDFTLLLQHLSLTHFSVITDNIENIINTNIENININNDTKNDNNNNNNNNKNENNSSNNKKNDNIDTIINDNNINNDNINNNNTNINEKTYREYIIELLYDIIKDEILSNNNILNNFRKIFKQEILLFFIDHSSPITRVLFLKILNIYLTNKESKLRFIKANGFLTLVKILSKYKLTEEIFSVLFSILLETSRDIQNLSPNPTLKQPIKGRRRRVYSTSTLRRSLIANFNENVSLKHPEVIQTILMCVASINCSSDLAYIVIKTLQDLFLQNDRIKVQFIDNHLIRLLCDIFLGEVRRQNNLNILPLLSEYTHSTQVEEHLISFLKALTVYSCTHKKIRIVESIIQYLEMMFELPSNYIKALQRRIISDVLTFFHENGFYKKQQFINIFTELCSIAVNLHRFYIVDTLPQVKQIMEKDKDKLPQGYEDFLKLPSFFPRSETWKELYTTCLYTKLEFYKILFTVISTPIKLHSFDILKNSQDLYSSFSFFILQTIKDNLPLSFESSTNDIIDINNTINNDTHIISSPVQTKHKTIDFLETKPIPAGNLFAEEFDTPSTYSPNDRKSRVYYRRSICIDGVITEVLDLEEDFINNTTSSKFDSINNNNIDNILIDDDNNNNNNNNENNEDNENNDNEEYDDNKKEWILKEKRKEDILIFIIDILANRKLLDIYYNDINFINCLLMYTLSLFHHKSSKVRFITFRLWSQITTKCKTIVAVRKVFNDSLYSYLQTKDPNKVFEKAIHIEHLIDKTLLLNTCYTANLKYSKENSIYKKSRFERMSLLIIPTIRNINIKNQLYNDIAIYFSKYIKDIKNISTEYGQKENDHNRTVQYQWKSVVKRLTHDRAIWKIPTKIFKLDATEGPNRMRKRLKPSTDNPLLYYLTPYQFIQGKSWKELIEENKNKSEISPKQMKELRKKQLEQLEKQDQTDGELKNQSLYFDLSPTVKEQIYLKSKVSLVSPFHKSDGEFLVCEKHLYFIDNNLNITTKTFEALLSHTRFRHKIKWPYHDIKELHKRRHLLNNNAIEIFLITGKTSLLSFPTSKERDIIYDKILSFNLPNHIDYEKEVAGTFIRLSITEKWQKGYISNLEYLMHLNTLAGRSFNDLTQYLIFPFIISDYISDSINIDNEQYYRDLTKPMGALDNDRFERFKIRYDSLEETGEKPFLYGTHYSNVGSVLHFLIRLAPFSYYFIDFQGGSFDVADRSFHSISQTWNLASRISPADVKELIPSFYILPEFLTNINHYNMGIMQKGTKINDIELPPWAKNDARLFIYYQRKALESRYVSENLHHWIDLIFGYKQTGEASIQAKNVFHPYTYEGNVNLDEIEDELDKAAAMAMIDNYGQTPKQVFKRPHPKRIHPSIPRCIFNSYDNLQSTIVGNYGFDVGYIFHRSGDTTPIVFPQKRIPLHPDVTKYVSWNHWDQNLRICSIDSGKLFAVIETIHNDNVICGSMPRNGRILVTGGTAGVVKLWKRIQLKSNKTLDIKLNSVLHGHSDTITCISVSEEWSIIVSGSQDKTCIIWDLNRACFIYTLNHQKRGKILCIAISSTTGDIVTVADLNDARCQITLWSINGKLLYQKKCERKIHCIRFTTGMEGLCDNIIFGGGDDGYLYFWSSWDLKFLHKVKGHSSPISAITINAENTQITSGDVKGSVISWKCKK